MGFVTWSEAISYGLSMIGYFLFVCFLGGMLISVGGAVISENGAPMGWLLLICGFVVVISGTYGAMYKLIADGVGRGTGHISGPQTIDERILAKLNE